MKITTTIIAAAITIASFATATNTALAQYAIRNTNNGTPVIYRHASTYEEGVFRGWADLARGVGDYNYNTSLALINQQHALSLSYDNEVKKVETYFHKRQLNKEYRAAERGPRKTPEDMARYMAKPAAMQLSAQQMDRVTKKIYWPAILQADAFQAERRAIEASFASRTAVNSGPGSMNEAQLHQAIEQLRSLIKAQTRTIGANNYITAKRFLDGLSLEASRFDAPQGLASLR